ncbi:MAG: efflux RND transporter periplasmic adaptor subunit [Planctomycetaceae bacterium]
MQPRFWRPGPAWASAGLWLCLAALPLAHTAFSNQDGSSSTSLGSGEQEVVIKREAVRLIDPRTYRAPMQLRAARSLELTAPVDGYVRGVASKPQQKVTQQAEILRLDDRRAALVVKGCKARLHAAQIERRLAQNKADADLVSLAEARIEAAQAELELAELAAEQMIVRAPFAGEIERLSVVEGQFVRAGESLATLVDASKLSVEVPVERAAAAAGRPIEIKVEETPVKATAGSLLPLNPRFDSLRELLISPASAQVTIDNSEGRFAPGQTVYSDLIPLAPVALVSSATISNLPDGNRKLQVLRDNVVRDLTVRILGKVGAEGVFVSGRFSEGDEVIISSTRSLPDGTPLRALAAGAAAQKTAGAAAAGAGGAGGRNAPRGGF